MNQYRPISDVDPDSTRQSGCVFILSNKIDNDPRIHKEYAVEMRQLWRDQIGCHLFQDRIHVDLTKNEIKRAFKDLSTMDAASQFDYLVVIINATGSLISEKNIQWANRSGGIFYRPINWLHKRFNQRMAFSPYIMGSDRKWYSESVMLASFFNDNEKWKGKPKLFILNYCRFAKTSDGYGVTNLRRRISKGKNPMLFFRRNTGSDTRLRIPTISDFTLVCGSSSRLVSEINEVFSDQWKSRSLSQMLTTVNGKMRNQQCWSVFESSQESAFMLTADHITPDEAAQEGNLLVDDVEDQTIDRLVAEEAQGSEVIPTDRIRALVRRIIPRRSQHFSRHGRISKTTLSKGCLLLISNALHRDDLSYESDKSMMENLWVRRHLCDLFEGNSYLNKSGAEMQNLCDRFSSWPSDGYEYAVIVISSHGNTKTVQSGSDLIHRSIIVGHNEGFLCEHDLLNFFNRSESTWRNKPKIFVFDYCRGGLRDRGTSKASPYESQSNHVDYQYNSNELPPSISTVVDDSIIVYATHSSYQAYSYGLIATISDVFTRYYRTNSILEMLTMVNAKMKQVRKMIAMSLFKSTLTEDYHLRPMADIDEE